MASSSFPQPCHGCFNLPQTDINAGVSNRPPLQLANCTPLSEEMAVCSWSHADSKGTVMSTGYLWLELNNLCRCYFRCEYVSGDSVIISDSGWHGRCEVSAWHGTSIRAFTLHQFRYKGYGAAWFHCMSFQYSKNSRKFTNRSCSCQAQGHHGITVELADPGEASAAPDLYSAPSVTSSVAEEALTPPTPPLMSREPPPVEAWICNLLSLGSAPAPPLLPEWSLVPPESHDSDSTAPPPPPPPPTGDSGESDYDSHFVVIESQYFDSTAAPPPPPPPTESDHHSAVTEIW